MKITTLLLALTLCVGCASAPKVAPVYAESPALPMPSFRGVVGWQVMGECDPFSLAATAMLQRQGIPARRITYGWSHFGGSSGYHAAVLFRLNGRFYFMDNQHLRPQIVGQSTDLGCVHHVANASFGSMYWMTDENNARVHSRKLSELFAPAPAWLEQLQESKVRSN